MKKHWIAILVCAAILLAIYMVWKAVQSAENAVTTVVGDVSNAVTNNPIANLLNAVLSWFSGSSTPSTTDTTQTAAVSPANQANFNALLNGTPNSFGAGVNGY